MTTSAKSRDPGGEKSIERILSSAEPRPVPSPDETEAVRQHVLAEWQSVAGRRKKHRSWVSLAVAASVLIAVVAVFNTLRINGIADVQVAAIEKSFGSVYVLGENAEMLEGGDLITVARGQILITDDESGVGLAWDGGGSLRIDANTRLEFVDRDLIHLHSGRIYFDSEREQLLARHSIGANAELAIRTDHGTVRHIGTRYMVQSDVKGLTVSVRQGEVLLGSGNGSNAAIGGQQLQVPGGGNASIVDIKTYGDNWNWAEQLSPDLNVDGRSIFDFLRWVSHETGLGIEFESAAVESAAKTATLEGTVNVNPTDALRIWMMGVDFDWSIEDGVIRIEPIDESIGESNGVTSEQ